LAAICSVPYLPATVVYPSMSADWSPPVVLEAPVTFAASAPWISAPLEVVSVP
jgi:hypothetical protein